MSNPNNLSNSEDDVNKLVFRMELILVGKNEAVRISIFLIMAAKATSPTNQMDYNFNYTVFGGFYIIFLYNYLECFRFITSAPSGWA